MSPFEREQSFTLGAQGVSLYYTIHGAKGSVSFNVYVYASGEPHTFRVEALDLCTHGYNPQFPNQKPYGLCEFLGGKTCFGQRLEKEAEVLLKDYYDGNEDTIWRYLEKLYHTLL